MPRILIVDDERDIRITLADNAYLACGLQMVRRRVTAFPEKHPFSWCSDQAGRWNGACYCAWWASAVNSTCSTTQADKEIS